MSFNIWFDESTNGYFFSLFEGQNTEEGYGPFLTRGHAQITADDMFGKGGVI